MNKLIPFQGIEVKPCQLCFPKYLLLGAYECDESDEFMARLIQVSKNAGHWVAVSIKDFNESLKSDYNDLMQAYNAMITQSNAEKKSDIPVYTNLWYGLQSMTKGLAVLLEGNYLELITVDGEDYLKPTIRGIKQLKRFVKKED